MELSYLRRAADDDVESGRLRRFPDLPPPPPPPHSDANASLIDAALAMRREELLLELNEARIRHGTILRELAETEHAMGLTAASHNPVPALPSSQDYWRCRTPSVPALEEEPPLRTPCSSAEHPPRGCRGPAAVRAPPVYPHVEWSPSPVPQAQPASDAEKQHDLRSPGARMNPFGRNVEPCRLPDKQTLAEEASVSVPLVANAEARPMLHEVTPGHNDAAGGRHKDSVKDGDDMHPLYESGNQSNVQRRTAETTQVDEVNGAMLQPGQYWMVAQYKEREFISPIPEQRQLGNGVEQQQECRSPGAGARAKAEEATSGHQQAFGGEHKADVEDGHGVQPLGEIRNQSSGQRKVAHSAMEGWSNKPARLPGQQHRPASLDNAAYNEQKKVEFSEPKPEQRQLGNGIEQQQECRSPGAGARAHLFNSNVKLCLSPRKRSPLEDTLVPVAAKADEAASGHQHAFGGEPKANVEDGHGMQPLGEIRNQSSGQRKDAQSAMEGRSDKSAQLPGQDRLVGLENAAYTEQKKAEFGEPAHEGTSAGVKRKLNAASTPVKKKLGKHSCAICHVNTPSPRHLEEHLAGRMHQYTVTALQASRSDATAPSTELTPDGNGKENAAGSGGPQQGQGGKPPHRQDAAGSGKKASWKTNPELYCKLCDLQCSSEIMLAHHLGGKKHSQRCPDGSAT